MTLPLAMILFGALLVYSGWKNESVGDLIRGQTAERKAKGERKLAPLAPSGPLPGSVYGDGVT